MFKTQRLLSSFILFFFIVVAAVIYFLNPEKVKPKIGEQYQGEELIITPRTETTIPGEIVAQETINQRVIIMMHNEKIRQREVERAKIESVEQNVKSNIQLYNDNLNNPEIKRQMEKEILTLTENYKKEILKRVKKANVE